MRARAIFAVSLIGCCLVLAPAAEAQFQPPGMWIWDNWFVHEGSHWHAFYLELPKAVGLDRRWTKNDFHKHVGHAISDDLVHWQDAGPALVALSDTWNDRHIATGSILQHEKRWWMFFTGRGRAGDGVGLALSDDLMSWTTEPRPLFPLLNAAQTNSEAFFESTWAGETRHWAGISDPYIYPEPVEGWFYLVLCARILQAPIEESGCLALLKSRDLRQWEAAGILAWPHCFERMETPQLWWHEGRWYLSFGGVLTTPWAEGHQEHLPAAVRGRPSHQNYVYTLLDFHQPAREEDLHHIAIGGGSYIMKVLSFSPGHDVALFTSTDARGTCLSLPSSVRYLPDGSLELAPLSPPEPKR